MNINLISWEDRVSHLGLWKVFNTKELLTEFKIMNSASFIVCNLGPGNSSLLCIKCYYANFGNMCIFNLISSSPYTHTHTPLKMSLCNSLGKKIRKCFPALASIFATTKATIWFLRNPWFCRNSHVDIKEEIISHPQLLQGNTGHSFFLNWGLWGCFL